MGWNAAVNAAKGNPALQNRPHRVRQGFLPQRGEERRLARHAVVDDVAVAELVSCACSLISCSSRFDCARLDAFEPAALSPLADGAALVVLTFDPSAYVTVVVDEPSRLRVLVALAPAACSNCDSRSLLLPSCPSGGGPACPWWRCAPLVVPAANSL